MSELLLPFARRLVDGALVAPEEVARGLACQCVCPGCGHPVQARQGTERVWHFGHAKAGECAAAYEQSVHETAIQLLRERKELILPALTASAQAYDAFRQFLQEAECVFNARRVRLEDCVAGMPIEEVTPDLVGTLSGHQLLIEITVFHRLMPEKVARLKKTGFAILEIDLGEFKTTQATRARLESALFESTANRRWVWHPALPPVEERLRAVVNRRLAESEKAWQKQAEAAEAERLARRASLEALSTVAPAIKEPSALHAAIWRASFPNDELRANARVAFSARHGIPSETVDTVFGTVTRRGDLARTTPNLLAQEWATALNVSVEDIYRYFTEGRYIL